MAAAEHVLLTLDAYLLACVLCAHNLQQRHHMSGAEEVGADNTLLGGGLHATASQKTCSALLSAGALQHKHTVSPKNSGTHFANNNGQQ